MASAETLVISEIPEHSMPVVAADGSIDSAGAAALRHSLKQGSAVGVSDLLKSMDGRGMVHALGGAGFALPVAVVPPTWDDVLQNARADLLESLSFKTDGFGLGNLRIQLASPPRMPPQVDERPRVPVQGRSSSAARDAASAIQMIMRSSHVTVSLGGAAPATERSSLQFVAGQALEKGVQGFGFDGLPGKYQVDLSMHEVAELHAAAAVAVAKESVRTGLAQWAAGQKVSNISPLVPDGIQQRLAGSVSLAAAQGVVAAVQSGGLDRRAAEAGGLIFASLLSAQGLDLNAKTVVEQAEQLQLGIRDLDREKGRYFGVVVAEDHKALLVKVTRKDAVALPLSDVGKGQDKPKIDDAVAIAFSAGLARVSVAKQVGRAGVDR